MMSQISWASNIMRLANNCWTGAAHNFISFHSLLGCKNRSNTPTSASVRRTSPWKPWTQTMALFVPLELSHQDPLNHFGTRLGRIETLLVTAQAIRWPVTCRLIQVSQDVCSVRTILYFGDRGCFSILLIFKALMSSECWWLVMIKTVKRRDRNLCTPGK